MRGDYKTLPVFATGIVLIITALWCHRKGNPWLSNLILYCTLILLVYLFNSSESPDNGGIVLYIPIALGAFASFDYKHRKFAMLVAGFIGLAFLATTFLDFHVLPWRNYSKKDTLLNMLIYFGVALPASLLTMYMLMQLNYHNAKRLVESNTLLKKSNEELDRFVYSTSHDLRAPLVSILGLINISEKTKNLDEIRSYLEMMKGRVNVLDTFIKDITDYSRNNRTEVNRTPINLKKLATEIWESLKYNQKAEGIHFEMIFDSDFTIESDPHRLKVILTNLISNAIRYHDSSKAFPYVRLVCKQDEKSFSFSVEDNGQGIAPEYHTKIFQMFFRAHENSTGSGLGLYIVNEAISKLSGRMQLQSEPSKGSTFTVSIPV